MKPQITVPKQWRDRSFNWAEQSKAGYAAGEKEASRQYARPGIDKSLAKQMLGRMGECAWCLYLHHDPEELDWGPKPDSGWDINHLGAKIDVKATDSNYLIWPVTKTFNPEAHIFALAVPIARGSDTFEMSGWVTVKAFEEHHSKAPPPNHFDPGSKHLHRSVLWSASAMLGDDALEKMRDLARANFVPMRNVCLTCAETGIDREASFGFGRFGLRGQPGKWYCREHKPQPAAKGEQQTP